MLKATLSQSSVSAGAEVFVTVESDSRAAVEIACFTTAPPPPGFKHCNECGTVVIGPHEKRSIPIRASIATFASHGGELRIAITNADYERRDLKIRVTAIEAESSGQAGTPVATA